MFLRKPDMLTEAILTPPYSSTTLISVFACVNSLWIWVLPGLFCVVSIRRTHEGSLVAHVEDLPLCWIENVPENWHICTSEESCSSSHQLSGAQSGILARPPLSYQEIALAFTHLLHDHTAIRRCNCFVNTQNEGTYWGQYDEEPMDDGLSLRDVIPH